MKTNWPALRHGYVILASMALANSPVLAQTPAGAAAVISSVAITQAAQRAAVRVEGEGRLDVHAARLQNPDRLVLDFAGARLAVQQTVIPGISAPVRGVRIGQYRPDVARVVVDLTTASPYQVSRDAVAVVIYFEVPSTTPGDSAPRVTTLASRQMETTRPEFGYSAVSPRLVAGRAAKDLQISAPRFALPGELTQPARRTDPALSHFGIVQREEGSCSPGLHDGTSGGWASGAAGKHGRHSDGDIGGNPGNAGPGSSGSSSSSGKVYR